MKLRTGDDNDYNVDDDKKAITITSFPKVWPFYDLSLFPSVSYVDCLCRIPSL